MRISIHQINVHTASPSAPGGTELYKGVSAHCDTTVSELKQLIRQIPKNRIVKQFEVVIQPLTDEYCEGTLDIYINYILVRKAITHKKELSALENAKVEGLLVTVKLMLEHLGTAPQRRDR